MAFPKTALIIVDIQNDFCTLGTRAVPSGEKVVPIINSLRKRLIFNSTYIATDWHPLDHVCFSSNHAGKKPFDITILPNGKAQELWPDHCVQNQAGSYIHKDLIRDNTDVLIRKGLISDVDSKSSFGSPPEDTGLEKDLRKKGISRVFVVGLALDYCVKHTALDAVKKGYLYILKLV